jgi:drug/metabolite transporter (DMT)-like permease
VFLGVVCTAIAYILYFRLIEKAGPSKTLTVTFLIPLFALVYGSLLLGEAITGWMVGCGLVILLGVALATGWLKPRPLPRP